MGEAGKKLPAIFGTPAFFTRPERKAGVSGLVKQDLKKAGVSGLVGEAGTGGPSERECGSNAYIYIYMYMYMYMCM